MAYRRPVTKADEQEFVKSLTEAREMFDEVIEKAQERQADAFDWLERLSRKMERIYRRAESMEE